ncbi:MAG TPA: FkbM family methyltransferase [Candidatus Angelobacter sp.]|nr:FkbM family methyltransferase [Candidatus Angelobacter sp.]
MDHTLKKTNRALKKTNCERAEPLGFAPDLIYDVGMHNGDDTAYYLHQGYRVVAIEADPVLAREANVLFAEQVRSGQLTILNVGIAPEPTAECKAGDCNSKEFWICDDNRLWNSFDRGIASRNGSRHHAIEIATQRFSSILKSYEVPFYLKVDIEGCDHLCVQELAGGPLPMFISVESECADDSRRLSEEASLQTLQLLHEVGYRRFKLISQIDLQPATVVPHGILQHTWQRCLNSLAFGRLSVPWLAPLVQPFTALGRISRRCDYNFPLGSTGPWGEEAAGEWMLFDQARTLYLEARSRHFAQSASPWFWCDWLATTA